LRRVLIEAVGGAASGFRHVAHQVGTGRDLHVQETFGLERKEIAAQEVFVEELSCIAATCCAIDVEKSTAVRCALTRLWAERTIFLTCWTSRAGQKPQSIVCAMLERIFLRM
jgi:hypothetical protein